MNRVGRAMQLLLAALMIVVIICAPASARLMRYDRATGQKTILSGISARRSSISDTHLACWSSEGVQLIDLVTGAVNTISADALSYDGSFDSSNNYVTWNGNLMDLTTGQVRTVDPNAKLNGNYLAYGSGSSYTVENLATGAVTNITAADGQSLEAVNDTSIIVRNTPIDHSDPFWGYYSYEYTFEQYDLLTGARTNWSLNTTVREIKLFASDNWVAAHYSESGNAQPIYAVGMCPLDNQPNGITYSHQVSSGGLSDIYGEYAVGAFSLMAYSLEYWNLDTDQYYDLHSIYPRPDITATKLWDPRINADYVTWFDDGAVPEPGSLVTLGGLLLGACAAIRRRRK